jgi:hypothetical protein
MPARPDRRATDARDTTMNYLRFRWLLALLLTLSAAGEASAQVLDKQKLLDAETFWDNRDWDWYKANILFFECPDRDIQTTYYYRWELVTKHLTYGDPNTGYVFTEFIDRPFWSGTYGAISCPAGLHLYEVRWLRDPRFANDYTRYWFRTPGAQPRRYSTWLADAAWAAHLVHPDRAFLHHLLPDLIQNYQGWEKSHFNKDVGLFWQTGHDDGMEININSRQTKDTVRGAPAYRPTLNSYLWADALAIARIAESKGDKETAAAFRARAAGLKERLQKKLWDSKRQFFFPMAKQDETREGHTVKALSLTYQTGKYAGSKHGRELIGYVPWQFNLLDPGYEAAWKPLMDRDGFFADYGPTTVERHDPLFHISKTCCWWSGNSWPYATTQTLKGMANLLQNYKQDVVSKSDYLKLLQVYARTHRKNGRPYIAEACHPDTGSWEGHDSYNHSEHYFHSGYVDLVITGLVGLVPREDDTVELRPLAPETWDYFAVEDIPYHQHRLAVLWDRTGKRYGLGKGLHVFAGEKRIASAEALRPLTVKLPVPTRDPFQPFRIGIPVNHAVNNGGYYPRLSASFSNPNQSLSKLNDGNYWYRASPPNRWTFEGSPNDRDWIVVDLGVKRQVHTVKLYLLDDGDKVKPPATVEVEYDDGKVWKPVDPPTWMPVLPTARSPLLPEGRRANTMRFFHVDTDKLRFIFTHGKGARTGLSEIEVWGNVFLPVAPPPFPTANLAYNPGGKPFPKASASFTSAYDKVAMANDGVISFSPSPPNRWTSFGSPNKSDWLEVDFAAKKKVGRVELAVYDDRGGVQAPASYAVQYWDGAKWLDAADVRKSPAVPVGGQINEARFTPVETTKVRIVFTHKGKARSGVSEVLVWPE